MKNITLAKQLVLALSIGVACSAHAQLFGRGGAVGGMIGGAGNLGGQLNGMNGFGPGALVDRTRANTIDAEARRRALENK